MKSAWTALMMAVVGMAGLSAPSVAADSDKAILDHGKKVYEAHCQECHEGGVMKAPHRTMLGLMQPSSIVRALDHGIMQSKAVGLSEADRQAVAAYITGVTHEVPAPPLPMCKPNTGWFDAAALPETRGWGFDVRNQRFLSKKVAGLTAQDMKHLRLKWVFAYPGAERARSEPLLAGGALFVGSQNGTVYALDQKTGCVHWTFHASSEVRTSFAIRPWVDQKGERRQGILYFGDLLGTVYAIDVETGKPIWQDKPSGHPNATITASPAYDNGRLYVSVSSLEVTSAANPKYPCCSFRGLLVAYDAVSGKKLWSSETIPEPLKKSGINSAGTPNYGPSGAPIWSGVTIDEKRHRLYVGTGENYSEPANDTSDSVIAFDADTGKMLWHFQGTKNDVWNMGCEVATNANCPKVRGPDFDFGASLMLAKLPNGKDILVAGQKSGEVFAFDPDQNGKLLWSHRVGRGSIQGGVHFGMATDGGILYVPVSDMDDGHTYPGPAEPGMHALDLATGKQLWYTPGADDCGQKTFCSPGISAAATAIPGGVVAGAMDGVVRAYDAKTGAILWSFNSVRTFQALGGQEARGGSFGGGNGPVFKDGMMYINSGYGIYYHMPGNALLAFELVPNGDHGPKKK